MSQEVRRDLAREGAEQYEEWRRELFATPEDRRFYAEEAAKKELWLQMAEARQAADRRSRARKRLNKHGTQA